MYVSSEKGSFEFFPFANAHWDKKFLLHVAPVPPSELVISARQRTGFAIHVVDNKTSTLSFSAISPLLHALTPSLHSLFSKYFVLASNGPTSRDVLSLYLKEMLSHELLSVFYFSLLKDRTLKDLDWGKCVVLFIRHVSNSIYVFIISRSTYI